jgi:hypothetical protein
MRTKGAIIITLIAVSMLLGFSSPAAAQVTDEPYVRVHWEHEENVTDIHHEYERAKWIFGPQPNITIMYADNSTDIAENNYLVKPNVDLHLQINIPHTFLGEGNPLDVVEFWGAQSRNAPRGIFKLVCNITADPIRWRVGNFIYRAGAASPFSGEVIELDKDSSSYSNETNYYKFIFAFQFVADDMSGIFWTGMQVIDTSGTPVAPSWLARVDSGSFKTPPMGLKTRISPREFSIPKFYMAELTNLDGEIIHYTGVGENFTLELSANAVLDEIYIPFCPVSFNPEHKIQVNVTWPKNPFREDTEFWDRSQVKGLWLFMTYNEIGSTTPEVVLGHENITWNWNDNPNGLSMWLPTFSVTENTSVPITDYYVENEEYTVVENNGALVQWAGSLTENVDLNPADWDEGGVISPDLGKAWVSDTDGIEIRPRVEIRQENTLMMAFKTSFTEAYVKDLSGNIIRQATSGETLNASFLVHTQQELLNGSHEFNFLFWRIRQNTTLRNATFSFGGNGFDSNDTHFWRTNARFVIVTDFETGENTTTTKMDTAYWFWNLTFAGDKSEESSTALIISKWSFKNMSKDTYGLVIEFEFTDEVPPLVIGNAHLKFGLFREFESSFLAILPWHYENNETRWENTDWRIIWSPAKFYLGTTNVWEPDVWTVTDEGAIDLDGNIFTTDDQYFVKRVGGWEDNGNITYDRLHVGILFDPDPTLIENEYWAGTWCGLQTLLLEFKATEKFYWYHTDDMDHPISSTELSEIQDLMWVDDDKTVPTLGYSLVAWLTKNKTVTLEDLPGIDTDVFEVNWFGFGTQQLSNVQTSPTQLTLAGFRAHYAGLLLFNDQDPDGEGPIDMNGAPDFDVVNHSISTDEVTHFFVIDDMESIEFRMPFGSAQDENTTFIPLDEFTSVEFGATISGVNGTLYPINIEHGTGIRGIWQLRESSEASLGLNQTNFDYAIETATIDEMSFDVHFDIDQVVFDEEDPDSWNHKANLKVDHYIGEWTLHNFDNDVLTDRGLAVNYYGILGTATGYRYTADGEEAITDTNGGSVTGNTYTFGDENDTLAEVAMGGLYYTWAGDDPPFGVNHTAGSTTAPIGAFSAAYESSQGDSIAGWKVEAAMLFMTTGFDHWDGHAINSDPVFIGYVGAQLAEEPTTTTTGPTTELPTTSTTTTTPEPTDRGDIGGLVLIGGIVAVVIIVIILKRRR